MPKSYRKRAGAAPGSWVLGMLFRDGVDEISRGSEDTMYVSILMERNSNKCCCGVDIKWKREIVWEPTQFINTFNYSRLNHRNHQCPTARRKSKLSRCASETGIIIPPILWARKFCFQNVGIAQEVITMFGCYWIA